MGCSLVGQGRGVFLGQRPGWQYWGLRMISPGGDLRYREVARGDPRRTYCVADHIPHSQTLGMMHMKAGCSLETGSLL